MAKLDKLLILAVTIPALAVIWLLVRGSNSEPLVPDWLATVGDPYRPSDESISPYDIAKNPYVLKGHSGVLDTLTTPYFLSNGKFLPLHFPGGALHFEKMIDEHTATYELKDLSGQMSASSEIAVKLKDSDSPNAARLWRVYVEGPIQGVNGIGTPITITAVRFEDYYEPPAPVRSSVPAPADVPIVASSSPPDDHSLTPSDSEGVADADLKSTEGISQTLVPNVPLRVIGGDVSAPVLVSSFEPEYSDEARTAKLAGEVLLSCTVSTQGIPTNLEVVRGLGMGLDEKAMQAAAQYRFRPAMENGKAVPVRMNFKVSFQLF